jgi:DNA-binding winged helix-turn-helix (wHTH) protein/Flp pilus assembly protein TadD
VGASGQSARLRFGEFELDLEQGELRRKGRPVRLQPQPSKVLGALASRPGELVTREELKHQIWNSTTFVDFEQGLNFCVRQIRLALDDDADSPKFIETVPRRGYRFVFPVAPAAGQAANGLTEAAASLPSLGYADFPKATTLNGVSKRAHGLLWPWVSGAVLTALGIASIGLWFRGYKPTLTNKDKIVLADFVNTTGDPVFDGALRQGLAVQLEQSPFLSLVSEEQIQQALRMMKQPPDMKLTPEIAREVCQRTSGAAVLNGSINQVGTQYSLILRAERCSDGESIASTQTLASDKSHVLDALGKSSSDIRKRLGESLASIQKFSTPLEQATTPSLDALQAYDLGFKTGADRSDDIAAIPLFQRATTLDPNFALAYLLLGMMYANLGEETLSRENIQKAYDLRSAVSQREKLFIESEYYSNNLGDLQKAQQVYTVWTQTYPRDWLPRNEAMLLYSFLGQPDKALDEIREAHTLYPESGLINGNLLSAYICADRMDEARAVAEEVKLKTPDTFQVRANLYRLAFLQNDRAGMEEQIAFSSGKPGLEDQLLNNEADTAVYYGKLAHSREFSRRAVASAQRAEEKETAAAYLADAALREALLGNDSEAQQQAATALGLSTTANVQVNAEIVSALTARVARVGELEGQLGKNHPHDTLTRFVHLPTLTALAALNGNNAPKAIEALRVAIPYELGASLYPAYYRGLAYLAVHQSNEAATEFQKILDHRGLVWNLPISSLAHLQLGRAFAIQGDTPKAKAAYQDFLTLWRDADPDIPILKRAKLEYARLQ